MAQLSYSQLMNATNQSQTNDGSKNSYNKVTFFSLKNNGEEAYVRFILDEPEKDMEILSTHEITVNSKKRKINCIKTNNDPSTCPFCANNEPTKTRIYLKLIEYGRDENGEVKASPKVWERPFRFLMDSGLKGYMDDYGNELSSLIFKVSRSGEAGSSATTYPIRPVSPKLQQAMDPKCPLDKSLFDGYKALGTIVFDKTADEIKIYQTTGNFPQKTGTKPEGNTTAGNPATISATAKTAKETTKNSFIIDEDGLVF